MNSRRRNLTSIPLVKPMTAINSITSSSSDYGGKLEDEIIIQPYETVKENRYKAFERIVIFANSQYLPYTDFMQRNRVTIIGYKSDSMKEIITLIKREQTLHSVKTLFLQFTGIFSIVKKCQINENDSNFKDSSLFTIRSLDKVSVINYDFKKSLISLVKRVDSVLEHLSAFTILPPFPPSIISTDLNFNHLHNIDEEKLSKYYICTFKDIETLKVNFCQYSMGLALFANYQALEINANNEPLEKYCSIASNWNDHLTEFSLKEISAMKTNSVSEKFKVWANAMDKFLFNCLNNAVETSSNLSSPSVTDISSTKVDTFNVFPSKEIETAQNISNYDHVVFVTCSEDQVELLPEAKSWISVINGNNCNDWRDIKIQIDTIEPLKSSKNALFVIFGSFKLFANEEIYPDCLSAGCEESLNYLNLCFLEPYLVIQKTKKYLQTLTKGIEQNYSNAKIIFIPLYPMTVVEITKDTHLCVHKLLLKMNKPSIIFGNKNRWKNLFSFFKREWEEEMYFRLRNTKKEIKDLIQNVSKSIYGLYWIGIGVSLRFDEAHIEKPRKSYEDLCKFKHFLNNLLLLAHPANYNSNTRKLPVPAFFLHLPIQSEKPSYRIQQHNEGNCCEKSYSSEPPFKMKLSDETLKISNKETPEFYMNDVTFISDKIPCDNIYILCKKDLPNLIDSINISNFEFIFYDDAAKLLEIDSVGLIQKMSKENSACLFMLDVEYFLEMDIAMSSCHKISCRCPVYVHTLNINKNMDSVDPSEINYLVKSKVMNVITFIIKLSVHLPVLVMPLFPTQICPIKSTMDHSFIHYHSSHPNFYFVSENINWKVFEELLANFWSNVLENNNNKYFEAKTLMNSINSLKILTCDKSDFKPKTDQLNAEIWRDIFRTFLNILSSRNVNSNKPSRMAIKMVNETTETINFSTFSIMPQVKEENLKEKTSSEDQNVLVIIWNHSTEDESSITKSFNCISKQISVLKYEDHIQIGVPGSSTVHIYGILKELVAKNPQIKYCVLEEKVFTLMKFKTAKCEGNCSQGFTGKCFYYHDINDKRRIPMSLFNMYKYNAIICSAYPVSNPGACVMGESLCTFCHNIYELNFHPFIYQTKICPGKKIELCEGQPFCSCAHEDTHEMFYNKEWKDLIVFGTENSFKFTIGAILGITKIASSLHKVKIIFMSPSQKMLKIMKILILNVFGENITTVIVGETAIDVEHTDVFLGTPSLLLNSNWNLLCRPDIKALVVDNALKILEDSVNKLLLVAALKQINKFSVVDKVFVSEYYDSRTAEYLSDLLEITLKEVKPKDVLDDQESSKYKGRGVQRSESKSPLNYSSSENQNKKNNSEKWRWSNFSPSRGTIAKEESRASTSRNHEKGIHHSREKSNSDYRKRHRSKSSSKTKITESSSPPRKKFNYEKKKASVSKELLPVSRRKRHSCSSSVKEDSQDKAYNEFSLARTLKLLVAVRDKLGIFGSAVLSLVKSAKDSEKNVSKLWSFFNEEENVSLLNAIIVKLKRLLLTSPSHEIPVISKSVEWVQKLIEEAKKKSELKVDDENNELEVAIDLNSIAQASLNKSSDHILELIKTAFAYEGKINPTKEEIHHAYLQVCYLHFQSAVKDSS